MNSFDLDARLRLLPLLCRAALPTMPVSVICERARALYRLGCERRGLLAQLPDFDLPQFDALPAIAAALEAGEAELGESLLSHGPVVTRLCEEAISLRTRFTRAARYFLRHNPEALRQVSALTHERNVEALTLDLGRIAELATHHELSLSRAIELPPKLVPTARRLAGALYLNRECVALPAIQERRNAIFWLLSDAIRDLEAALSYLDPEACTERTSEGESEGGLATPAAFPEHRTSTLPPLRGASVPRTLRERSQLH